MKTSRAVTQRIDLSAWLTKPEAATALQVSFRTLDKFVTDGRLQSAKRQQPGKPPAAVYHPGDVEQLRQERQPPAHVLPAVDATLREVPARTVPILSADVPILSAEEALGLFQACAKLARSVPEVRLTERLFLTIKEAAALSGLPRTHVRRLMAGGQLSAQRIGRRWFIRRKDVEAL